MPTTIYPPWHPTPVTCISHPKPKPINPPNLDAKELLECTCFFTKYSNIGPSPLISSSFHPSKNPYIIPDTGLIECIFKASQNSLHLRLRPEDVWLAILVQLKIYLSFNPNPQLAGMFGNREEKLNELTVDEDEFLGNEMQVLGEKMDELVQDEGWGREWCLPDFTTTTTTDRGVAAAVVMSRLKVGVGMGAYSNFGIPSITLLGEKEDWEKVLERIERIPEFGNEPAIWYSLLKPVLARMVNTFDDTTSEAILKFWRQMLPFNCLYSRIEHPGDWLTSTFSFWDSNGIPIHIRRNHEINAGKRVYPPWILDGAEYHMLDVDTSTWFIREIHPAANVSLDVKIKSKGKEEVKSVRMVAGLVGMRTCFSASERGPKKEGKGWWRVWKWFGRRDEEEEELLEKGETTPKKNGMIVIEDEGEVKREMNTIQPESGWWVFSYAGQMPEEVEINERCVE